MTPLLGFLPDADPTTPGVIADCSQLVPNERAMASAPSAVDPISGLGALAGECRGFHVFQKSDGSRRLVAGTQTRIYAESSGTWGTASATFTGSSENRWMFAQFGDTELATNDTDQIQYATATTYAAVAGAPKARILISTQNFVVAMNTNDATASATYGDSPDRWWCSAFQNPTDWAPSINTQCATERIIGQGGEITAGAAFGTGFVVYKAREMFLAVYVGPPSVFQLQRIPGDQGCVGPEAVDDIGGPHVFLGEDNVWLYDGSRPIPIADGVRQWLFDEINPNYGYRSIVRFDQARSLVWLFYPSASSSGNPDAAIVYHLRRKMWGRANRTIQAAGDVIGSGATIDSLDDYGATIDGLPNIAIDSPFWFSGGRSFGVFNSSNQLKSLTGTGENATMTTGDIGDDSVSSFVSDVRLRFLTEPTSATVTGVTKTAAGAGSSSGGTGTMMTGGKFPIRQNGRFHQFTHSFTGPQEVSGIRVSLKKTGAR